MAFVVPSWLRDDLKLAHPSWRSALEAGLEGLSASEPGYLPELASASYLPTRNRLFAAFAQPLSEVRYVLVGEGPYPREESATGFCFMDGAVGDLWSDKGLSKRVNRATSLRNFMKMLLVAEGRLQAEDTGSNALSDVAAEARKPGSGYIHTLPQLQANLTSHGFLLLNAALVFRPEVPPLKEGKAWRPFLQAVLSALSEHAIHAGRKPPTLVLWGKVAELLSSLPANKDFPKTISEHPYNLSFIRNPVMRAFFGPMRLLRAAE